MRHEWVVQQNEQGLTLRDFLHKKFDQLSNKRIKHIIDKGYCTIQGKPEKFYRTSVLKGQKIGLLLPDEKKISTKPQFLFEEARILYEDEDLFIYDKPSGIICDDEGIIQLLKPFRTSLYLAHRLDKDTTGVCVFAKNAKTQEILFDKFRKREVFKSYLAIVDGFVQKKTFTQESEITSTKSRNPKEAKTEFRTIKREAHATLLTAIPHTGRTHQIRIHLQEIGHPILGDFQYGKNFQCTYEATRQFLHAEKIVFSHPRTNEKIQVIAPLAKDMKVAITNIF